MIRGGTLPCTSILCANRDEYLDRPALPATWHEFPLGRTSERAFAELVPNRNGSVLSGIDVPAGGTWMGINRAGRIAFLTNITEPAVLPRAVSRGVYVASFLDQDDHNLLSSRADSLSEFLDLAVTKPGGVPVDVGGFNLLLFEAKFTPEITPASTLSGSDPLELPSLSPSAPASRAVAFEAANLCNFGTQTAIRAHPICSDAPAAISRVPGNHEGEKNSRGTISFGGLSNAIDGSDRDGLGLTDPWTKVTQGRNMLEDILTSYSDVDLLKDDDGDAFERKELQLGEDLMNLLGTHSPDKITALRDLRETIFVPPTISHELRSDHTAATGAFGKWYGTRLSTVILVRRASGEVLFVERDRLRARSPGLQSTSTSTSTPAGPKGSGGDPNAKAKADATVSLPEILSLDEARTTQRVFRFTIEK